MMNTPSSNRNYDVTNGSYIEYWDRLYKGTEQSLPWEVDFSPPEMHSWIQHLESRGRILDIGCGRGIHAMTLTRMGFFVHGIDISAVAIAAAEDSARQQGLSNVAFEIANIAYYRTELTYDLAFDYSVFHHIPEEARIPYIESVRLALKPRAFFAMVCYSDRDEDAQGQKVRIGKYGNVIYHLTKNEIISLFENNFEICTYGETTLGRNCKHLAHAFMFRKLD